MSTRKSTHGRKASQLLSGLLQHIPALAEHSVSPWHLLFLHLSTKPRGSANSCCNMLIFFLPIILSLSSILPPALASAVLGTSVAADSPHHAPSTIIVSSQLIINLAVCPYFFPSLIFPSPPPAHTRYPFHPPFRLSPSRKDKSHPISPTL